MIYTKLIAQEVSMQLAQTPRGVFAFCPLFFILAHFVVRVKMGSAELPNVVYVVLWVYLFIYLNYVKGNRNCGKENGEKYMIFLVFG